MADLRFDLLTVADCMTIEAQPSQRVQVGMSAEMTEEIAADLASQDVAWAARDFSQDESGRLIACFGIAEQFEGRQGLGWAILAEGIGAKLVRLTRFIAHEIATCGLARVEVLAKAPNVEPLIAAYAQETGEELDSGQIVALALLAPTPQMRWAAALGMTPAHVLRCYGAKSESYMLYERISPPAWTRLTLVERAA